MKKQIKKIVSLALLIILCLSLCSCRALDDMRKFRAVYLDEARTKISYNDETFILVENWNEKFETNIEEFISVSDKEVPLLLTTFFSEDAHLFANKRIICVDYTGFYCREDVYEYVENVTEKNLTHYCYNYYDFESGAYDSCFLDEDRVKAIEDVLKTQKPSEKIPEIEYYLSISKTDTALLMKMQYVDLNVDVDGNITISMYDDENGIEYFYAVPKKYKDDFSRLVAAYGVGLYR